ncbi:MAG TPA: hypothetical protein PK890_09135 [Terrimesophilobacter sp.]|nr:hypothetical protein [Terrimesophilobacter sp.]
MIGLTEPQVWVLIGVFATAIFGMLSWQTVSFNRTVNTAIGSVQRELEFFRESIDARFDAVDSKFDAVDAKFEVVNHKIDSLDRDVQALTRHVFGTDPR